jgi:hypothetical protein
VLNAVATAAHQHRVAIVAGGSALANVGVGAVHPA